MSFVSGKEPVLLIYPPIVAGNYGKTYPSVPVLAASLRAKGYSSIQLDLNNYFLDWYLRSTSYRRKIEDIKYKVSQLENSDFLTQAKYDEYVSFKQMILYDATLRKNSKDPACIADAIFDSTLTEEAIPDFGLHNSSKKIKTTDLLVQFYNDFFSKKSFERPLFVGISVSMAIQIIPTMLLTRWLKTKLWKNIHIYCGGSAITLASRKTLKTMMTSGIMDGVVSGEGEESVVEIARQSGLPHFDPGEIPNYIFILNGEVMRSPATPHRFLNDYPAPLYDKRELKKWNHSNLTTIISRRCYWGKCAYCNYQSLYLRKQVKEVSLAVKEIEHLTAQYGLRDLALACDTVEPYYVRKLCRTMIKRKLDVRWQCYLRVDNRYSLHDLKLMEQSGCELVAVGLESLQTRVLNLVNKGYTSEDAVSFLRKLLKTSMEIQVNMIIDLPGTNYASAKKQHSMLRNLLLMSTGKTSLCRVAHFRLSIDLNMPIGRNPHKYGIRLRTDDCISHHRRMLDELVFYDPKGMTEKEKRSIESMYDKLNEELRKAKHYYATKNMKFGKEDWISFDNNAVSIEGFEYDANVTNKHHRKIITEQALAYNCERDAFSTIYDVDTIKKFIALLPMKLGDLEKEIVEKKTLGKRFGKKHFDMLAREIISQGLVRINSSAVFRS